MLSIAYYFLQVIVCSAVMMGYYWLVLRNKRFHQYNRFYLLAVALLSWTVPLIKIQWNRPQASNQDMMRWLYVVADSNSEMEETIQHKGFLWNWDTVAATLYVAVAGLILLFTIKTLIRLYRLLKMHSCRNVEDVYLIITRAKGTPFSFFRYIFWNEAIDLHSESGKQILQHELTHVRQKHSIDKLLMQLVLVLGWFNPFFWLLRREMDMIHEFIADKKAVVNGDTASLAQMLLTAAYPQQHFALTNPFFFSPIKRRLQMLTNNKNPRFTYVRRLVVLPLLAVVVMLFAFRNKERHQPISVGTVMETVMNNIVNDAAAGQQEAVSNAVYKLDKQYTVVIDAGHGGQDRGAVGVDGSIEKDIALELAQKIKSMNSNDRVKIVLTRESDVFQPVTEKAQLANAQHPDLFISLHCDNTASTSTQGIELFIASKEKAKDYQANYRLANYMASSLGGVNKFRGIQSSRKGIWVLQEVNCPSVLIEAGFMSNPSDMSNLKSTAYQQKMAGAILTGIQQYLSAHENQTTFIPVDTTIEVKVKDTAAHPLFVVDGEKMGRKGLKELKLDPNDIDNISVLKDEAAFKKYGEEGKNGVVEITTKKQVADSTTTKQHSKADLMMKKLNELKKDNEKSYFEIDGKSVITTKSGQTVWIEGVTDLVLVDGKRVSVDELNTSYKRSDFVEAAGNDYSKKYHKGVLLLSTRTHSIKEIQKMLAVN